MLKVKNIVKLFKDGNEEKKVLKNVSVDIQKGEFVTILGPSGSGKTTLLNIMSGIDIPNSGTIEFEGKKLSNKLDKSLADYRALNTGFIFQNYNLISVLNVYENIKVGFDLSGSTDCKELDKLIEDMGLTAVKYNLPNELSGGQRQRVAIARALAKHPSILFCDEPTGALDEKTGKSILTLLQNLNKDGMTIVMVTHNPNIKQISTRSIYFKDGEIINDEINDSPAVASEIGWS